MTLLEVIKSADYAAVNQLFISNKPSFDPADNKAFSNNRLTTATDYQMQAIYDYQVDSHSIFDTTARPNKSAKKDSGEVDGSGNPTLTSVEIAVARIGLPLQKLIVERRVGFMLSDPVKTEAIYASESDKEKRLEKIVERIQNDNKMDYRNKEVARRMMSELECAEIWYFVPNNEPDDVLKNKLTLRVKLVSPVLGDKLYPLFDETGDLISFARAYKIREDKKEIEHFDVFTTELEYKYVNRDNVWKLDVVTDAEGNQSNINPIPNSVKKIMVIYHSQPRPEWADVQSMISRLETTSSNHADTNDYFGSPVMIVKGTVKGYAQKGETGKILEVEGDQSGADYLSWDSSPESVKNEKEDLKANIHAMSQTPDISFEKLMAIGNVSGIALKLMFIDAHMAVKNKEEIFGLGLQRRLNLIKACIGMVIDTSLAFEAKTLQLKPVMTPYLPQNVTEMIDNLNIAVTGGILSKETAVDQNPLVEDSETEMDRLKNDATAQLADVPVITNKPAIPLKVVQKGKNTTGLNTGA